MEQRIVKWLTCVVIVVSSSFAQAKHQPKKQVSKDAKPGKYLEAKSLDADAKKAYMVEMRAKFPIIKQKLGPFGLSQDLSVKTVAQKHQAVVKTNLFPKAVAAIPINGISKHTILSGATEYRAGEIISLVYKHHQFQIKILSISPSKIAFKNIKTGEVFVRQTNAQPKGFQKSGSGNLVPNGVIPAKKGGGVIEIKE